MYSEPFASALQDMFAPLGFGFRRQEVPAHFVQGSDGTPINMIAARRTGRRVCTIYFHTDTLPAGEGWARPPFLLSRQGNRLYGRGAAGMKGAIAAVWSALRAADAVGLGLRFDPVLLFCTDAEGGFYPGLRHLAASRMVEGHVMCLDGSAAPRICVGMPGSLRLQVRITAKDAARQENAAEAAAVLIAQLHAMKAGLETKTSALVPPSQTDTGLRADLAVSAPGSKAGVEMPTGCELTVTRSYLPEETVSTVQAELMEALEQAARNLPAFDVRVALRGHYAPVVAPDRGTNTPRWQQALGWGFGYSSAQFRRGACQEPSAMGFVQQAGVQEILFGGLGRPHSQRGQANEFTTIEDVEALARAVLAYLADIPDIPPY